MIPRQQSCPPWRLLLAAALVVGACRAGAARSLAQAANSGASAVPPPGGEAAGGGPGPLQPSQYGAPEVDQCVRLTNSAGQACTVESDTLSLVYTRGSEQLPTQEQVDTAIANMKAAAQPSKTCCQSLQPYSDARCPCDPGYQQLLPIGGFDPAYFEGSTSILARACGLSFPPCKPGETAFLPASGGSG